MFEDVIPAKAASYFKAGYNCAQSVLLTMQRVWNVEAPSAIKAASAFGGGIGRRGSVCGALTGGVIAIGLRYGSDSPLVQEREKAYSIALEFYNEFEKRCGSVFCIELTGCDLTDSEQLERARKSDLIIKKCAKVIEESVRILIELGRATS